MQSSITPETLMVTFLFQSITVAESYAHFFSTIFAYNKSGSLKPSGLFQLGRSTSSCMITKVKQYWAWLPSFLLLVAVFPKHQSRIEMKLSLGIFPVFRNPNGTFYYWLYIWLHFFDKATSFEKREAHRYLNNRLGIFRDRGGGLLDHPYWLHFNYD